MKPNLVDNNYCFVETTVLKKKRVKSARNKDNKTKGSSKSKKSDGLASSASTKKPKDLKIAGKNKIAHPSELQEILAQGGVSDINYQKKMLIKKIRNNEIDPSRYSKVIEAISGQNEPDEEALEIKKSKKRQGSAKPKQQEKQAPVVNFNYNSYIKIGAYPPPVINTLIVNGNNYIPGFNQNINMTDPKGRKGIKDFVTTSKGLLAANKGNLALLLDNS